MNNKTNIGNTAFKCAWSLAEVSIVTAAVITKSQSLINLTILLAALFCLTGIAIYNAEESDILSDDKPPKWTSVFMIVCDAICVVLAAAAGWWWCCAGLALGALAGFHVYKLKHDPNYSN